MGPAVKIGSTEPHWGEVSAVEEERGKGCINPCDCHGSLFQMPIEKKSKQTRRSRYRRIKNCFLYRPGDIVWGTPQKYQTIFQV